MIQRHAADDADFHAPFMGKLGNAFIADGHGVVHADDPAFGLDTAGKGRCRRCGIGHERKRIIGGLHARHRHLGHVQSVVLV